MNVYDFDDTIYKGDSSKDFILYMMLRHPIIMLKEMPGMMCSLFFRIIGIITTKEMKERFFRFLSEINNIEDELNEFWNRNQHKVKSWYLEQKKIDDVIISASPEFLLSEICQRLNITVLIATRMDVYTGKISGENCKGQEKVMRFYEVFGETKINEFYSDSKSDRFLAKIAEYSYIVKNDKIMEWKF